jgi:hypothetical protein
MGMPWRHPFQMRRLRIISLQSKTSPLPGLILP